MKRTKPIKRRTWMRRRRATPRHLWAQLDGKLSPVTCPGWTLTKAGPLLVLSLLDGGETVAQLRLTPSEALTLAELLIAQAEEDGA